MAFGALARLLIVGTAAAAVSGFTLGCGMVATEKPLYQASDTTFDPQLLGIWSVPAEAGQPGVLIIAPGKGKSYRFTSVPDSGGSSAPDEMDLVRLGKYEYFFWHAPQLGGTVLFPAYRVKVSGREMHMSLLNEPQFVQELRDHPGVLAYTEEPVRYLQSAATQPGAATRPAAGSQPTTWPAATNIMLTDRPEKIRRSLIEHEDDSNWFAEVLVLHRLTPPVRR